MNQAPAHSTLNGSRLSELLQSIAPQSTPVALSDAPEQIAQLMNFTQSITLSKAYSQLAVTPFEPGTTSAAILRAQFLATRAKLTRDVIASFDGNAASARFKLPAAPPNPDSQLDPGACEPYQKLYIAHQRQFDWSTQDLRARIRQGAAGLSPELARLAALDSMLSATVSAYARQSYAAIPRLLKQRFFQLHSAHPHTMATQHQPSAWLATFCHEMKSLLLAEIDDRLLPVLGIIEAINHGNTHT